MIAVALSQNQSKKQSKKEVWVKAVGQKRVGKHLEKGGYQYVGELMKQVGQKHVTDELFDSNPFHGNGNIKVTRNYDHGDTTI